MVSTFREIAGSAPPGADRHPDQEPALWDAHVDAYQDVFEPLSDQFAARALRLLGLTAGQSLIDCAAGAGGAALMAARGGLAVTAIDAAPLMVARIAERAAAAGLPVRARCMDAERLDLPDARFDGAVSVFGLILCRDPAAALRELRRVTVAGGPVAVVTWSEPERYELAARLLRAAAEVRGASSPPAAPPPQLRFREEGVFRDLFGAAGFGAATFARMEAPLRAPSAAWLAARLAFAPGLSGMLAGFGADRDAIIARFAEALREERGEGPVELGAVATIGLARVPDAAG